MAHDADCSCSMCYHLSQIAKLDVARERKAMRTWIVKAIDVPMMQAHMPFYKLTREVQAETRSQAIEAAKQKLWNGCEIKSAAPKRERIASA